VTNESKTLVLEKDFDISPDNLKKHKELLPVQDKLDREHRSITVLVYESQRKPSVFKCNICGNIWTVAQARYVTQQKRGCKKCASSIMSIKAKARGKDKNGN
jgi:formylmethanofuran dehydrogenase subunit E